MVNVVVRFEPDEGNVWTVKTNGELERVCGSRQEAKEAGITIAKSRGGALWMMTKAGLIGWAVRVYGEATQLSGP